MFVHKQLMMILNQVCKKYSKMHMKCDIIWFIRMVSKKLEYGE